jgi:hypothetical protein
MTAAATSPPSSAIGYDFAGCRTSSATLTESSKPINA